jgi:hypothetical protein
MNASDLFIITAAVSFVLGGGLFLAPGALGSPYGLELDEAGANLARLLGAVMLGHGALNWAARNAEASDSRQAIILGQFVANGAACVAALVNQLSGTPNSVGWIGVVVHLFLALGYARFQFAGRAM